jgi:hypothetical protein
MPSHTNIIDNYGGISDVNASNYYYLFRALLSDGQLYATNDERQEMGSKHTKPVKFFFDVMGVVISDSGQNAS